MKIKLIIIASLCLALAGCQTNHKKQLNIDLSNLEPQQLTVLQYEKILFEADSVNFQDALKEAQPDFMPFLGGDLDDTNNIAFLRKYVSDTVYQKLYKLSLQAFPDIHQIEKQIKPVYQRFGYYFENQSLPRPYTYISGANLEMPILFGKDAIAIGLDNYLGAGQAIYRYMRFPVYRIVRTEPVYISRDLGLAAFDVMVSDYRAQNNLLSEMVFAGTRLYFTECLDPTLPDSVLLGYTANQLDWAKANEGNIWAAIVGENLLYSTDGLVIQKFMNDGPFTAEFSNESPARLGEFIGLQIVRQYMNKNSEIGLKNLIQHIDAQLILRDSKYKPRK